MKTTNMSQSIIVSMLLAGWSLTQVAWGFETLFTTPKQRDQLDQMRYKTISPQPQNTPITPTKEITLNGLVHRSSGEHTVWVNGFEVDRWASPHGSFEVHHDKISQHDVPLLIKSANKNIRLQPGQTANLPDGQVSDLLPSIDFPE